MSASGRFSTERDSRPGVGHVAETYFKLTENWIHTQVRLLSRYRPVVFTERTRNLEDVSGTGRPEVLALRDRGLLTHLFNEGIQKLLGFRPSYLASARRHGLDLLHAHFGPVGHESLRTARWLDIPLLVRFYGHDLSRRPVVQPRWKSRYRTLFEQADHFLVEGPAMKEELCRLGCPEAKVEVQRLGIELDDYEPASRLLRHDEPLRILMVGRFVEKKGFPHGLRAVSRLRARGLPVACTLVGESTGADRSRRETGRIRRVLEEEGIEDRVRLPGRVPHGRLRRLYYDHHLLLVPSVTAEDGDHEGGAPVSAIEAAATGMPVVASRHQDLPEVVEDGETGFLVPEREPGEIARALARFVEEPPLLARFGEAGRRRVERRFSARRQVRSLEETYDELLGRSDHNE